LQTHLVEAFAHCGSVGVLRAMDNVPLHCSVRAPYRDFSAMRFLKKPPVSFIVAVALPVARESRLQNC
jgi:hypothetical protein